MKGIVRPQSGNGASITEVNNCGTELLMTSRLVVSVAALSLALLSSDGKLHLRVTGGHICEYLQPGGIYKQS